MGSQSWFKELNVFDTDHNISTMRRWACGNYREGCVVWKCFLAQNTTEGKVLLRLIATKVLCLKFCMWSRHTKNQIKPNLRGEGKKKQKTNKKDDEERDEKKRSERKGKKWTLARLSFSKTKQREQLAFLISLLKRMKKHNMHLASLVHTWLNHWHCYSWMNTKSNITILVV